MIKCAKCNAELADNAMFCSNCGEKLIKNKTCPGCGAVCDLSVKFCSQCGFNFSAAAQAPAPTPVAPAAPAAPEEPETEAASSLDLNKIAADQAKGIVFEGTALVKYPEKLSDPRYQCPAGITKIGEKAFENNDSLRSVVLPDTVIELGECAFECCGKLATINLPESIKKIGKSCFCSCISLGNVKLPDGLEELGESNVFSYCYSLTEIAIPAGIITVPYRLCFRCKNLVKVSMPPDIDAIGEGAFAETGLASVRIPKGIKTVPHYFDRPPFAECEKLKTVYIHRESTLDKESIKRLLPKRSIFNQVAIEYYS